MAKAHKTLVETKYFDKFSKEEINELKVYPKNYKKQVTIECSRVAVVAQLVEHLTCNENVVGSTPINGSYKQKREAFKLPFFVALH